MNIIQTNLQFKEMNNRSKTERIIIHHAAIESCTPEQIHNWHLEKGWSGAGYHFLVRKDGSIYRLRPEDKVGAHAYGSNYNSIGICAEGNYTNKTMPKAQYNSMCELMKYIKVKYDINLVQKHSDVNATSCPGESFSFNELVLCSNNPNGNNQNYDEDKDAEGKIAQIQKNLNIKYNLKIAVDNIPGNETRGALVFGLQRELNVQFNKGLAEDKIFGPKTKKACINVSKGANGNITWLIQAMLVYHSFDIDVDGIFGDKTEKAIREFQRRNNIAIDGICGKNTFEKLFK